MQDSRRVCDKLILNLESIIVLLYERLKLLNAHNQNVQMYHMYDILEYEISHRLCVIILSPVCLHTNHQDMRM